MLRYAITDRSQFGADERVRQGGLLRAAARWAAEKIDFIQLREKDLPPAALVRLCRDMSAALAGFPVRLLVNSRVDVALAAGLSGVHLTSHPQALTPAAVRTLLGDSALVSVSCHTAAQVYAAAAGGADLILFGPVFGKTIRGGGESVEVTPAVGLEALRDACAAAGATPVLALGGVTRDQTERCVEAGARGVAGIRLFAGGS